MRIFHFKSYFYPKSLVCTYLVDKTLEKIGYLIPRRSYPLEQLNRRKKKGGVKGEGGWIFLSVT